MFSHIFTIYMIETQLLIKIVILHSNNGNEYFNEYLSEFSKNKDIVHQSTKWYCLT